jgi:hypothetical protein
MAPLAVARRKNNDDDEDDDLQSDRFISKLSHSAYLIMAPRETSHEPTSTPDPVEKGFATLNTLRYA